MRLLPTLTLGVEWKPGADEVGSLVNWVAVTETERRPALIVGTSSDRIGTPEEQAYFGTVSRALGEPGSLSLDGYEGISYGTFEGKARLMGG